MELTGKVVLVTGAQQGIAEIGKRLWVGNLGSSQPLGAARKTAPISD
jgi:hypothetical protein